MQIIFENSLPSPSLVYSCTVTLYLSVVVRDFSLATFRWPLRNTCVWKLQESDPYTDHKVFLCLILRCFHKCLLNVAQMIQEPPISFKNWTWMKIYKSYISQSSSQRIEKMLHLHTSQNWTTFVEGLQFHCEIFGK